MYHGYTQTQLAEMMQVTQGCISKMLSGRYQTRRSTIIRLARVTGQTYAEVARYFYQKETRDEKVDL